MTLTRIGATKNKEIWRFESGRTIDRIANTVRARFATPGKHQIYSDKREEAVRYLAAAKGSNTPDLTDYPFLQAEIGLSGSTAREVADLWVEMDYRWRQVAAVIEKVSLTAKAQIRAANSQAEIESIIEQARTVLDGIGEKPPERPKSRKTDTLKS